LRGIRRRITWTCYQSEWATDVVCKRAEFLKRLMGIMVPQAMLSFSCADILRYFGRRVKTEVPERFNGQLESNLKHYREGGRVKFWMQGNSTKFYDKAYQTEGSVLRAGETTLNKYMSGRVGSGAFSGTKEILNAPFPQSVSGAFVEGHMRVGHKASQFPAGTAIQMISSLRELRCTRRLVDYLEMGRFQSRVVLEPGCETAFQNAASQKRSLHWIGSYLRLEHQRRLVH
jgi:hypothetical protein